MKGRVCKFSLAPRGVLAPGSAHSRSSAQNRPKCLGGGQFLAISGDSKNPKKLTPQGQEGSPKFVFTPNLIFFVWLKTPCKISEPYDTSFWEKSNGGGEKEKNRR